MVYCSDCGTDNEEDAEFCIKCEASLRPERGERRRPERPKKDECFGLPHARARAPVY